MSKFGGYENNMTGCTLLFRGGQLLPYQIEKWEQAVNSMTYDIN